jgi:hypothetical protein
MHSTRQSKKCARDSTSKEVMRNVVLEKGELVLSAEDETKLEHERYPQQKLVRRSVPLKALSYGDIEPAAGRHCSASAQRFRKASRKRRLKRSLSSLRIVKQGSGLDSG